MADPKLIPLDYNPFEKQSDAGNHKLTPLDYNPFEKQAAPPAAEAPAPAQPEDTSYDPGKSVSNFIPSLAQELNKIWMGVKGAAEHPVDTADTLARMAVTSSPLSSRRGIEGIGWMAKKLGMSPEAVDAAIENLYDPQSQYVAQLTEDYGGTDKFKKTLEEKPAQVLFDLSSLLGGASAGLKGATSAATQAGRIPSAAAKVASKVGNAADVAATATDPAALLLKGAQGIGEAATAKAGVGTGVGGDALKEAARTGFVGGKEGADFWRAYQNGVPAEEIVGAASKGVRNIKKDMMAEYAARKNDPNFGWVNDPTAVNFSPIRQAWNDVIDSLTTKSGQRRVGDAEWDNIQKVGQVVSEWEQKGLRSVDDIDGLKQRIRSFYPSGDQRQLKRVITEMANATGDALNNVPGYKKAMQNYHKASDELWEMEKAFALNDKASLQTAMSKLQSVMRNNANTQYGLRTKLLGDIEKEGDVSVRPLLAGSALSSLEPRGLARVMAGTGTDTVLGGLLGGPLGAGVGAVAGLAGSSPKIVGGLYHGLGRGAGLPASAYNRFMPDRLRNLMGGDMAAETPYRAFGRLPRASARVLGTNEDTNAAGYRGGGYLRRKDR